MKYFCYQGNDYDCGFASLKMLLAILNKNKSFLYIDKPDKKNSYTFKDIIEIGKSYGLNLCAYAYSIDQYEQPKAPFLALIDCNHCVLVKRFLKKKIEIYDPGRGILKIKKGSFQKRWSGKVLEVESFENVKLEKKEHKILPVRKSVIGYGISALAITFLLIGFFFVKDNEYVFIPIIFLAFFAICELVEKWYLIKELNFFDNEYIPKIFDNKTSGVKEAYHNFISFKQNYFTFGRKIFSSFVLIFIITTILILNNPYNAFAVLFILLLTMIEKVFISNKTDMQSQSITEMEQTLVKDNNANLVRDILSINQNASDYTLRISVRKCINTFIIIILSFLLMIIEKEISVNFILFHFGIFYILMDNMDSALSSKENKKNYEMSKARFLDSINL